MSEAAAASSDDESIKPVSSLRSRFESLGSTTQVTPARGPPPKRVPTPERDPGRDGQIPTPARATALQTPKPERDLSVQDAARKKAPPPVPRAKSPQARPKHTIPRAQRPLSMLPASPTQPLPRLDVTSPTSPPKPVVVKKIAPQPPAARRSPSPNVRKLGKDDAGPSETHPQANLVPNLARANKELFNVDSTDPGRKKQTPPPVPPTKRTNKPSANLLAASLPLATLPERTKATTNGKTGTTVANASQNYRESVSNPTKEYDSKHPMDTVQTLADTEARPSVIRNNDDGEEIRPALPPRRTDLAVNSVQAVADRSSAQRLSALSMGFSAGERPGVLPTASTPPSSRIQNYTQQVPSSSPARSAQSMNRDTSQRAPQSVPALQSTSKSSHITQSALVKIDRNDDEKHSSSSPDSSQINRRIPYCSDGPPSISMGYDARIIDVCGGLVCTGGILVRVWDSTNGRLLLSMPLGEQVKATAIAFKPSRRIEDEGTTLWVGTDWGELMEIDIASKRVNKTNGTAHSRREVVRLLRHNLDIWSIDDEGKFWVWPASAEGPDLDSGVQNARLPRRPTLTLVVGDKLWVANGREIRVFEPASDPDKAAIMHTQQPLGQSSAGEITCGTILASDADSPVYIGHSDGKVSIYRQHAPFECLSLLSISPYKINCMLGVGNLLWAGFSLGHICIYDPTRTPWTVRKEWRTHTGPVVRIVTDINSDWKIASSQVISLGTDESLGLWDGLLEADWLDDYMHNHQADYCTYQSASATVLTWNAGAVKPADLKRNEGEDARFFQDLFSAGEPPDILVCGLQELVDLEDKRLTAKSFLKGRHKDAYGQEHLSTAYRAWRDYLTWTLDETMPPDASYVLLHTASLVGLFTCIFVKAPLRNRIHSLAATEVKTGMGGLHGNKGALLVRFLLDDTSLCFINCHLAAGQTHTQHRNNDITSILESSSLPALRLPANRSEVLTSGGDGTMILDHEICILHGDLNYRIDTIPRDSVISAVRSKNYKKLLERDQLLLMHRRNPGFRLRAFTEGGIDFAPTYKYNVGSDEYDTSEKRRVPAWCDRILWRGRGQVEQVVYERHDSLRASDHRPVSSIFNLRIKSIDAAHRTKLRQQGEIEFKRVRSQISDAAKLSYLRNYFGLTAGEAQQALQNTR